MLIVKLLKAIIKQLLLLTQHLMGFSKFPLGGHQLGVKTFNNVAGLIVTLVYFVQLFLHLLIKLVLFFSKLVG
jgi:hypothetical protein